MAHPYHHALSSVRRWGGAPELYLPIHQWFDASKAFHGDFRHRALRHHAQGIFECEQQFGVTLTLPHGRTVPVRFIAEQHVIEDLGRIPSLSEWLQHLQPRPWMNKRTHLDAEMLGEPNMLARAVETLHAVDQLLAPSTDRS